MRLRQRSYSVDAESSLDKSEQQRLPGADAATLATRRTSFFSSSTLVALEKNASDALMRDPLAAVLISMQMEIPSDEAAAALFNNVSNSSSSFALKAHRVQNTFPALLVVLPCRFFATFF